MARGTNAPSDGLAHTIRDGTTTPTDGTAETATRERPKRLKFYEWARRTYVLPMADWIERFQPDRIDLAWRLWTCGQSLEFRLRPDGRYRLASGRFCQLYLLCPICAVNRAAQFAYRYAERVALALQRFPDAILYFITLTHRASTDLAAAVGHLLDCVAHVHARGQRYRRDGRGGFTEAARVLAAVHATELGWNPDTFQAGKRLVCTPHLHGLWLSDSEIVVGRLSKEWADETGGSWRVDARPLRAYGLGMSADDLPAALVADSFRVFQYAQKYVPTPERVRWAAYNALSGRGRSPPLIRSYAGFRGAPPDLSGLPSEGEQNLIRRAFEWEDRQYVELP